MIRFLKWVRILFWSTVAVVVIGSLLFVSISHNKLLNTPTFSHEYNINNEHSATYKKAIEKSRNSAVLVMSGDLFFRGHASLSGTYFVAQNEPYIITAAHGIIGPCFLVTVSYEQNQYDCEEYVLIDRQNDYAIVKLAEKMVNREPMRIPQDLPQGNQWRTSYSILNKIIYTGYPNTIGPLTLNGNVIGYEGEDYLYIFSYAYGGASGSGVYATNGKYIGLVAAIDIGQTTYGTDILENVVLVIPVFKVDWSVVLN